MTPTVIRAETTIFGITTTEYYIITNLQQGPESSKASKEQAEAVIAAFGLPRAYSCSTGEIYTDGEGCFARWKKLQKTGNPKSQNYKKAEAAIRKFLRKW